MSDYTFATVKRKASNAGTPKGKRNYILLFRWDDVKEYERDEKGVLLSKFSLLDSKSLVAVYGTSSTINAYHTTEGDEDARGMLHHVDFEHPGTTQEFDEFLQNNLNEKLGAIVLGCDGASLPKIAGTPCQPLSFTTADSQDNNEADKNTINLTSTLRGPVLGRVPLALIPATDDADINTLLGLTAGGSGL